MNELVTQLTALLGGQQGWIPAVAGWVTASRVFFKTFNSVLVQPVFNKAIAIIAESPDKDDDAILYALLSSKLYRAFAFIVDLAASIKLPNVKTVFSEPTTDISPVP